MAKKDISRTRKVKAMIDPLYKRRNILKISELLRMKKVAKKQGRAALRMHDAFMFCAQTAEGEVSELFQEVSDHAMKALRMCENLEENIDSKVGLIKAEGKYSE